MTSECFSRAWHFDGVDVLRDDDLRLSPWWREDGGSDDGGGGWSMVVGGASDG